MRVLLLQPEDSPRRGPWTAQRWDLVIDLGTSSKFSASSWQTQTGATVLRSVSFRRGIEDVRRAREILSPGRGRLLDAEGIDWWDLTSLAIVPQLLALISLQRLAEEVPRAAEFWATRRGGLLGIWESLLGVSASVFGDSAWRRSAARAAHYGKLVRTFSAPQFKEIVLDKYDPGYRWRSRFSVPPVPSDRAVILLPSAYENVSRVALAYARLLPSHAFLMVTTRRSATQVAAASNVVVRDLSGYATPGASAEEFTALLQQWAALKEELRDVPELKILDDAGVLGSMTNWMSGGLGARDAWRSVLEREPVEGVLCGDDSNLYTRLPVLLAARRNIRTADFHHGALDGRYVLKDLPSDIYLAKSEMERDYLVRICGLGEDKVVMGAPASEDSPKVVRKQGKKNLLVFFSEPYEVAGMRAEEVYREILPGLCEMARANGLTVALKLHPFENAKQRVDLIRDSLGPKLRDAIQIVAGPLTSEFLAQAWCGVTLESSTIIDCLKAGVCCFLCAWLPGTIYQYTRQYARFGIGELLDDAGQIAEIPDRVRRFSREAQSAKFSREAGPELFDRWLGEGSPLAARSAS